MNQLTAYTYVLRQWQASQPQLQAIMGADYPAFQQRVTALLAQLQALPAQEWDALFRRLLDLDMEFPATADILRHMRVQYRKITQGTAGVLKNPLRNSGDDTLDELPEETTPAEAARGLTEAWQTWQQPAVVNTGFVSGHTIHQPLAPTTTLQPNGRYYFWLDIAPPHPESIEQKPTSLPLEELPPLPVVNVVLHALPNELQLVGATQGALQLLANGTAEVARAADAPPGATDLNQRLYFAVQTPAARGTYRLRCDIYHEQVLVQGRLVQAMVTHETTPQPHALTSMVDYTLVSQIRAADLPAIAPHALSMASRQDTLGTHTFAIYGRAGEELFSHDIHLSEGKLTTLLETGRKLLHHVTWGTERPWNNEDGQQYRYATARTLENGLVRPDLGRLARWGYRFYTDLVGDLAGQQRDALTQALEKTSFLHFASQQSATLTLPLTLLYDYPLDTNLKAHEYTLCPAFLRNVKDNIPWVEMDCFCGRCPSKNKLTVVCPSGFWGYRHALGMPIATAAAPPVATAIHYADQPAMIMSVSTDKNLSSRPAHEKQMRQLWQGGWHYADSRVKMLDLFKGDAAQLVYFYCHGGWAGPDVPALHVGAMTDPKFTRDNLGAYGIRWAQRPLVFINGCHTTALRPTTVGDFATGFVEDAHAAGVIGTEITIFEPLAQAFAEAFIPEFAKGTAVGEAIRLTRLALLRQGNPLGLVYIPYVLASLRLTANPTVPVT